MTHSFRLPEPHEFGQGDALFSFVLLILGVVCFLLFGVGWYLIGKPEWLLAVLGVIGVVTPFGLMFYKAYLAEQFRHERHS